MIHLLQSLRDFLDPEQLKYLPGNLRVENCILLTQHKEDSEGITRTYLQIFDHHGNWIGECQPDYIPND